MPRYSDPAPAGTRLDPEHWISLHDVGWLAEAFPKARGFFLLLSGVLMICLPPDSKLGLLPSVVGGSVVGGRRAVYVCETSFSGSSSQGEHTGLIENKYTGDKDAIVPGEKIEWRCTDRRKGALQGPVSATGLVINWHGERVLTTTTHGWVFQEAKSISDASWWTRLSVLFNNNDDEYHKLFFTRTGRVVCANLFI